MAIVSLKVDGGWAKVLFESPRSRKVYEMDAHWESAVKKWVAVACRCEGFTNRGSCSHLALLTEEMKGVAAPTYRTNVELKGGFWLKCGVCSGVEFMLKPEFKDPKKIVGLVCSKCGRYYEWQ